MIEGENLAKWTEGMAAWEKRVHLTHMLAKAYDTACKQYNFEKVARKIGMLMTITDEPYEGIVLQGLGDVTFTDADGGSEGADSDDDDDDEDEEDDDDIDEAKAADEDEDAEVEVLSSDDEEDDTDPQGDAAAAAVGEAVAPEGYEVNTQEIDNENFLIGKFILAKLASPPLEENEYGWYRGCVQKLASEEDKKKKPDCPFIVRFKKDETNGVVPPRYNKEQKTVFARVPLPITPENRGSTWCLLKKKAS
jgi:hypothetical protein